MKMIRHLAVGLLLASAPGVARAQAPASSADEAAVRTVVASYLHGLKFNDVPSLKAAFWPDAKLYWKKRDGSLGVLSQEDWYKGFAQSAGKEEKGELRIASLEITKDIASVKVVEDYPGSRYIDYVSLVNFGGKWMIVAKVYTSEKT